MVDGNSTAGGAEVVDIASEGLTEGLVVTITEDEAALYDRQIRLWGLDAQKRWDVCNRVILFGNPEL